METPIHKTSDTTGTPLLPPTSLVVRLAGGGLLLCAVLMVFSMILPFLSMSAFIPAGMIVEQVIDFLQYSHSTIFIVLLLMVGGLLLLLHRRVGWMLGLAALIAVLALWAEGIIVSAYSAASAGLGLGSLLEFGWELVEMMYYVPILLTLLQIACLVGLLLKQSRSALQVRGMHFLVPIGIALFVVLEQNILVLVLSMANG